MKNWMNKLKKYLKEKNRFIVQNPISFQQKFSLTLTNRNAIIVGTGLVLFFTAIVFLVISFTSLKNLIPGYPSKGSELFRIDKENQRKLQELTDENKSRELWINNLQNILNEKDSISFNTINESLKLDSSFNYKSIYFERTIEDSILREKTKFQESEGKFSLAKMILKDIHSFELPVNGKVEEVSSKTVRSWNIRCKKRENILNTMEGTVVFQSENSLVIHHNHELVSTFTGISQIKAKIGQHVEQGDRLGSTTDTTLLFQLFYKGESLPLEVLKD